jgi:hypothetical protein
MSTTIPTAPLPAVAAEALARLERAFLPLPLAVVRAVTRYETAAVRAAELATKADLGEKLSDLQADDLAHAEDLMAGCRCQLEQAGRLDLIGATS